MLNGLALILIAFIYWRVNKTDRARRIRKKTEESFAKECRESLEHTRR